MSAEAGPSKVKKSRPSTSAPATEAPRPALSKETIETDDESGPAGASDSSSEEDDPDSDADLEGVEPRRKHEEPSGQSINPGAGFPKYNVPPGMSPLSVNTSFSTSPFEWDAIASKPNTEIWAIRVPKNFNPSRLTSLALSFPQSSSEPSGSLKLKSTSYTLVPAGRPSHSHAEVNSEGRVVNGGPGAADSLTMDVDAFAGKGQMRMEGGEEMSGGMRLLVPRITEGGKLFVAPRPIKRHFLLVSDPVQPVNPAVDPSPSSFLADPSSHSIITPNTNPLPSKRAQPSHLLKFRNKATGFDTPGPDSGSIALTQNDESGDLKEDLKEDSKGDTGTLVDAGLSEKKKKKKKRESEAKDGTPKKKKVKTV